MNLSKSVLKRYFVTGLFVLIPVGLTLFLVVWLVGTVDSLFGPLMRGLLGFHVPGVGILATAALILLVGMLMSNLIFQQIFEWFEDVFLRIPGVRVVYKTLKALTDALSPDKQVSFRRVVLVEYPHPGSLALGFVTSQMTLTPEGGAPQKHLAVYVPSNHFYLGQTVLLPEFKVQVTSLSVQEGIQLVLSSGAGFPDQALSKNG